MMTDGIHNNLDILSLRHQNNLDSAIITSSLLWVSTDSWNKTWSSSDNASPEIVMMADGMRNLASTVMAITASQAPAPSLPLPQKPQSRGKGKRIAHPTDTL
jgi:hypothetical protein